MKSKRCVIFAAGDYCGDYKKHESDIVIAADAGYHHLKKSGITPDILLGDFDTIGEMPEHSNIITYNPEKDYTDTELAIMEGIRQGCNEFFICGAIGGKRLEHTVANLSLAASYSQKGYSITLTDGNYIINTLNNGTISFPSEAKGFISVFTISGKAEGVTISGLKYSIEDATFDSSNPTLGVSNEFTGKEATISVKNGTLIIIWQKDKI